MLRSAERSERPLGMPVGRPRGAKAQGVRYEKACSAAIPQAKPGQWWHFIDANGPGYCQTDLVLIGRDSVLVLECKYTWTMNAWEQLERLYLPVVEKALARPAYGVQLCKVLRPEAENVVYGLREALAGAMLGRRIAIHWSGTGPLGTRVRDDWAAGPAGLAGAPSAP